MSGDCATIQVYEDTTGLEPGDEVAGTGRALSVNLGPGLLGGIFDGLLRSLTGSDDFQVQAGLGAGSARYGPSPCIHQDLCGADRICAAHQEARAVPSDELSSAQAHPASDAARCPCRRLRPAADRLRTRVSTQSAACGRCMERIRRAAPYPSPAGRGAADVSPRLPDPARKGLIGRGDKAHALLCVTPFRPLPFAMACVCRRRCPPLTPDAREPNHGCHSYAGSAAISAHP